MIVLEENKHGTVAIERAELMKLRADIANDINDGMGYHKYRAVLKREGILSID